MTPKLPPGYHAEPPHIAYAGKTFRVRDEAWTTLFGEGLTYDQAFALKQKLGGTGQHPTVMFELESEPVPEWRAKQETALDDQRRRLTAPALAAAGMMADAANARQAERERQTKARQGLMQQLQGTDLMPATADGEAMLLDELDETQRAMEEIACSTPHVEVGVPVPAEYEPHVARVRTIVLQAEACNGHQAIYTCCACGKACCLVCDTPEASILRPAGELGGFDLDELDTPASVPGSVPGLREPEPPVPNPRKAWMLGRVCTYCQKAGAAPDPAVIEKMVADELRARDLDHTDPAAVTP